MQEIEGLSCAADVAVSVAREVCNGGGLQARFVLFVGVTPTATSVENLLHENQSQRSTIKW